MPVVAGLLAGWVCGSVATGGAEGGGLLVQDAGAESGLRLSPSGSDAILHVLAAAKAFEADLVGRMGELESVALRNLLKQAILATDPGLPKLWQAPS